ncbi:Cupredoxin [Pleurotus pulmonarius]
MAGRFAFALSVIPAALAATYDVHVGAGGELAYTPPYVNAVPGDIVNFIFRPKNHTVTQSSFEAPCVALPGGERSGFRPVPADTPPFPNFQFHVADTTPKWFYCGQTGHCGQGMVFAINPAPEGEARSFTAFRDLAIATNGTAGAASGGAASPAASSSVDTYVTPPAPKWATATATVTQGQAVWTTTYTSYEGTPPPTPAPQPVEHRITVGANGEFVFTPSNIQASVGDKVVFEFRPKNHTVTQSSFSNPCRPLADVTGVQGFRSGFVPVAADATTFPTFEITVNDTAPIWGYCGQGNHCGTGMVFSINAVESGPNNFAAFQQLARRINGTEAAGAASGNGTSSGSGSDSGSGNGAVSTTSSFAAFVGSLLIGALVAL